jgi:hypothetical protein
MRKIDRRSIAEHLYNRENINRKPYRTATQKADAARLARKVDGHFVSSAKKSFHQLAARRPLPLGGGGIAA